MKHSIFWLVVLLALSNIAYADSWTFTKVTSVSGGEEDVSNKTRTSYPHTGTVTITLDIIGDPACSNTHRVRRGINNATIYTDLIKTDNEKITGGCRYFYEINTISGTEYYVQVEYPATVQDWVIIDAYSNSAVTVMAEGQERGEHGDDVVRAYCPSGYTATSGYCKIWDDDEDHYDPSPDVGILGSNYYQCRNPYSIYEDRYTHAFVGCN